LFKKVPSIAGFINDVVVVVENGQGNRVKRFVTKGWRVESVVIH
jgi:hypothetical protein